MLVSKVEFQNLLQSTLGDLWPRAESIFEKYGERLSFDVTNVLLHATEQEKTNNVLLVLEKHYEEHLQFQHPRIRGTVRDALLGVNPTENMFLGICQYTLGLQPDLA